MNRLRGKKFIIGLILAVSLWSLLVLLSDRQEIVAGIKRISLPRMLAVVLLSSLNYWVRIIRFNWFTGRVAVKPIKKDINILIFFSGLSMNLTPVRIGEVIKAYFQQQFFGESFARMAPIVFIERLTDALAILVMMSLGVLAFKLGLSMFIALVVTAVSIIFVLHQKPLGEKILRLLDLVPFFSRLNESARRLLAASAKLTGFFPVSIGTFWGLIAWSLEAAGIWILLGGAGVPLTLHNLYLCLFTFSAAAAAGFISVIPGGLGVNELSTIGLLQRLIGISASNAIAITFVFRLATLWFGILLGIASLIYLEKRNKNNSQAN